MRPTIGQDQALVIPDTLDDPIASTNPWVTGELGVRVDVAAPIITADGHRLGTVIILDTRPRQIDDEDVLVLHELACIVLDELELRLSMLRVLQDPLDPRAQAGACHGRGNKTTKSRST